MKEDSYCDICKKKITTDDMVPPGVLIRYGKDHQVYAPVCGFCQFKFGLTANSQGFLSKIDGSEINWELIKDSTYQ